MLNPEKVKLGIAPIGWTNDDMPDLGGENTFEQCVSEMALAGYQGCEIGNKYPAAPRKLKEALSLRGLTICNRWFSAFLISKPFEETARLFAEQLDFLKEMGAKVIGVSEQSYSIQGIMEQPVFEGRHTMDEAEWKLLCDGLNGLGRIAKDRGMTLTFHHHMGTVVQTREEIDRMMRETDPDLVFLLFDSGHLTYCGIDALAVLRDHAARVRHVHLKDVRPEVVRQVERERLSFLAGVRRGAFTVPGDGCIDFDPLFRVLEDSGYEGWMVVEAEQDPAIANPLLYAMRGRAYIREKTGL